MDLFGPALLQAIGPLITVVLGSLVVGTIVRQAQERRADALLTEERLRADNLRDQEQRRADNRLRDERLRTENQLRVQLVGEMTDTASRLYSVSQNYWRKRDREGVSGTALEAFQQEMDDVYQAFAIDGEKIEQRLEAYFEGDEPREQWHAARDLLTVRYFTLLNEKNDGIRRANEGCKHSGLTFTELQNPDRVLKSYRTERLPAATRAVMTCPMRPLMV